MARCRLLREWRLRRLCVLIAFTCVFATSVSSASEWPFSETFRGEDSRVEKCAQVSGFSFRQNTTPNVQQLARMCADPDCSYIVNMALLSMNSPVGMATFRAFTEPVVSYCWFFRAPGDPCRESSIRDSLLRFKDKDASCESTLGVSIFDRNSTRQNELWLSEVIPKKPPCGDDCLPLVLRVLHLMDYTTCPMSDSHEFDFISPAIMWYCQLLAPGIIVQPPRLYYYSPGWPLPVPPQSTTTPQATSGPTVSAGNTPQATSASSASAENTEAPAAASTPVSEAPGPVAANERVPRTTEPAATPSSQSGAEDVSDNEVNEPFSTNSSETARTGGRNSTGTAPRTRDDAHEPSTISPANTTVTSHVSHNTLEVIGAGGIFTIVFVAIFIYMRRKGVQPSNKDGEYSTIGSPHPRSVAGNPSEIDTVLGLQKAFPVQQAKEIRTIGSGGYGVVYLVRDTLNNRLLASKRMVQNQITDDSKIDSFFNEIRTVSKLRHPRIVAFVGATWTNRTDVQALFEYMDGGDLRTYLETTTVTDTWTSEKLAIAMDIAEALVYVHSELSMPLVHRDLKSRNVLLSKSPLRAKLSDFGVAREVSHNESMTNGVGTSRWLAPEVILGRGDYGTACDIYSFGVVLSELDTHMIPFWDCSGDLGMDSVLPEIAIMRMVALEGRQPTFSASCPPKVLDLARLCLAHDPQARPTAPEVARFLRDFS